MLRLTRLPVLLIAGVAASVAATSAIAGHHATVPTPPASNSTPRLVGGDMMYAAAPNYNEPPDKKLDAALTLPGMRGVIEVTIMSGPVGQQLPPRPVTNHTPLPADIVSNWTARVDGYYGSRDHAFVQGQEIVVQTLGGTAGGRTEEWTASPNLRTGMHVMIFVRQWTHYLDGSALTSPNVVYIADSQYFAAETGGSVQWVGHTESRSEFIAHFLQHPVPAGS